MIDPRFTQLANLNADRFGLPRGLVLGVLATESDGNPNAVSEAGAMGLMQLMPVTAQTLGVTDPFDPEQNVQGGTTYLSHLLRQFPSSWEHVLVGYRNGAAYVQGHLDPASWSEGARSYVRKVFQHWVPGSVPSFDKRSSISASEVSVIPRVEYLMPDLIVQVSRKPVSGLAMGAAILAVMAGVAGITALALRR